MKLNEPEQASVTIADKQTLNPFVTNRTVKMKCESFYNKWAKYELPRFVIVT